MLFSEKITVYFENNVKSIKTLCGQNSESLLLLKQMLQVIINVLSIVNFKQYFSQTQIWKITATPVYMIAVLKIVTEIKKLKLNKRQ